MDKIFAEMFSRQPDEISGGDYFYHTPWYKPSDKLEQREESWFDNVLFDWKQRTFQDDFNSYGIWMEAMYEEIYSGLSGINEIFSQIASENKPFMDISSSHSFGLIPFIAKLNPQILCMATDIDMNLIKCLRLFINRNLTEYNINLAALDNFDMPIKNNSLDYITSTFGIASRETADTQNLNHWYNKTVGTEKPISEVYRILKPGGCFVTIESDQDWKFDLEKTRKACNQYGNLFGKYACNEIEEMCDKLKAPSWRDKFAEAGFQVEVEEKYFRKVSGYELRTELYPMTRLLKIREWTDNEREEYFLPSKSEDRKNFNKEAADYGIEFNQGEVFYVLRKPK